MKVAILQYQNQTIMCTKKASVTFKGETNSVTATVHSSYSRGGVHYYDLTIKGNRQTFRGEEIADFKYIMG